MAISNLIWWPWFGKHTPFIPPVVTGDSFMGGTRADVAAMVRANESAQDVLKRRRLQQDEEDFAFLLTDL